MEISGNTLLTVPKPERARVLQTAREFETVFLTEMLKSAGVGKPLGYFGGGEGEAQFSSLLVREQAKLMVAHGGIGLAKHIAENLAEAQSHDG